MKLPTKEDIKKLSPDEAKVLLDKLDDCRMSIFNKWDAGSSEVYWLTHIADELTWKEFNEEDT